MKHVSVIEESWIPGIDIFSITAILAIIIALSPYSFSKCAHSKNCGVKITPPVLIEDHMHHAFYTGVKFAVLVQHPVLLF